MAAALHQTTSGSQAKIFVQRWFFTGMALVMLMTVLLAFVPSIAHPAGRRAPLSILAAAHGIVFLAWLVIFLIQSWLVATRHVAWHKRLGLASIFILAAMIPLAYETTIGMVRRGFDLSGDLAVGAGNDPAYQAVFPLFNILIFSALVIGALAYRSRPEVHKRLMLFANIELMPAPLGHIIGHHPLLAALPPAIVMVPISMFVIAAVTRDLLVMRRIHLLTWGLSVLRMIDGFLEAGPIGSSAGWHHFVSWLAR
jgi:hypothetical protein